MKKSLFALAAVGAIAGTAQAQSSVTVYGLLDLGYVGTNQRIANNSVSGSASSGGVTSSTTSAFIDGAESTSRLGFKGNEDLGGGLSAFFTVETSITPNSGNTIGSGADSNRQTFVGLKKSGIGQFAFGTQYTTIFNAAAQSDPGLMNNMMGNVIYDKGKGVTYTQAGATVAGSNNYSGMQNNTSFTVRSANMLSVASETFSGFQGNGFIVQNNANTNASAGTGGNSGYTGGSTNHTGWGLGANYTWHKLFVTANYQNFTDKNPYNVSSTGTYTAGAPTMGWYGGAGAATGTNARDNQQYYAATYDFGILKAYIQYVNRKTMDVNNSNMYVARTGQQIGVRSFITPVVEGWASVGTGKLTGQTSTAGNSFLGVASTGVSGSSNAVNFGGFQLGSNYWLSKRTNLYAIYGQERTSNQIWVSPNPSSYNSNAYALGVRHTF
ncbi:porin [Polynucleobacter paneuropaeus]|uniref:porin n=1 Tax=Polynucleobacter paneuropaeus TaxID=2527775 RepID=UPI000DBF18AF|nr:porin [Polynucleobacter paneuropaeus]AWW47282.1 porin [Polynucleobacter paneuropaeus]